MSGIELATIGGTVITAGDALLAASTLVGAAGFIQQGAATKAAAESQAQAAQFRAQVAKQNADAQAQLLEQRAGQERAISQRTAIEERRRGEIVGSRAQAIAAASGGGALDPTIVDILAGVDSETEVRALTALNGGEEVARGLEHNAALERSGAAAFGAGQEFAAASARNAGEAARRQSLFNAAGTVLGGGFKLVDRFGRRLPRRTQLASTDSLLTNFG